MPHRSTRKKEEKHRFNLVMPESLFRKAVILAHDNNRSVTMQIISALQWATREIELDESQQPDADV